MFERTLIEAAAQLRALGEAHVIATVVRISGSAYRRPGARMLIAAGGWVAGGVSGGCLEADLVQKAWWHTENGPALVRYDSTVAADADGDEVREAYGIGCGGVVEILLERADPSSRMDPIEIATRCRETQQRCAIATVFRSDVASLPIGTRIALAGGTVELGTAALPAAVRGELVTLLQAILEHGRAANVTLELAGGVIDVLLEPVRPPPRLFVFGAGRDVIPLVQLARQIGWDVVVCTKHARNSLLDRLAGADEVVIAPPAELASRVAAADRGFAVVMTHSYQSDLECLAMLLDTKIGYIGVLGPRARTQHMLATLGADDRDPRLHAPIGLALGAETPSEIALAIAGEIQASLAQAPVERLRDRTQPIHVPPAWPSFSPHIVVR